MKKKLLATAIASALVAPASFAAEGSDGMNYTSASEGFYGTLRVRFDTGAVEDDEPGITTGGTSQIGVRGTLDLGSGLTGFYQWETNVDGGQKAPTALRKKTVGIQGAFGEVKFGSFTDTMIGVSGHTDVANSISGNFDLSQSYRVDNSVAYTTPDLNGFQASVRVLANPTGAEDENTVDDWAVNGSYSVQGLTAVAGYRVAVDGLEEHDDVITNIAATAADDTTFAGQDKDDAAFWGLGLGYGQDNWNVGFWYGEAENRTVTPEDFGAGRSTAADNVAGTVFEEDTAIFSVAGDVTVGKVKVYAFTETRENTDGEEGVDDTVSGAGVQYSFTTQTRVWMDYQANDWDSETNEDDKVIIGMRYDF